MNLPESGRQGGWINPDRKPLKEKKIEKNVQALLMGKVLHVFIHNEYRAQSVRYLVLNKWLRLSEEVLFLNRILFRFVLYNEKSA